MPQQDPVQAALDSAKKTLASANAFQKSAGGPMAKPAPKPAAPVKANKPKGGGVMGLAAEAESAAKGLKAKADNVAEYNKSQEASGGQKMPQYEKGGKVKKDGPAMLHKGETVLPKDKKKSEKLAIEHLSKKAGIMSEAMQEGETPEVEAAEKVQKPGEEKAEKKDAKKGFRMEHGETVIKHHKGGTATVKHTKHRPMGEKPVEGDEDSHEYAVQNMDELMSKMQQHVGPQSEGL
jgi:hypothetical protein